MDLNGTRHADELLGSLETDTIFGRQGDDVIFGYFGSDELRGGNGNDYVSGSGEAVFTTPYQNLSSILDGAVLFGGNGRDWLSTEMTGHSQTFQTGGRGGDVFEVQAEIYGVPDAPVDQNRVDILDFGVNKGDRLDVRLWRGGEDYVDAKTLFHGLDTDHNGVIDGKDPGGPLGFTWSDPAANAVCLVIGDGDMVAVHGVTALTDGQIYG